MIPSTIVGVIVLVYIVLPGFVFQWARAGTRPRAEESATHALARVLVAGVLATTMAAAIVFLFRFPSGDAWFSPVDPSKALGQPGYTYDHLLRFALTGAAIAAISCFIAFKTAEWLVKHIRGHLSLVRAMDDPFGETWWNTFHDDPKRLDIRGLPSDLRPIRVSVVTKNNGTVSGFLRLLSMDYTSKDMVIFPDGPDGNPDPCRRVIIPLDAIAMVDVEYLKVGPHPEVPKGWISRLIARFRND